ncbi:MAG: FtsX-like permease family protein [Acidobacteria bacterium]|nr:MAG: FtsX-like permease family protein [Acidobacteriota bacterium]
MRPLAYFRSLAARFLHRSQIEDDMEEELRSHVQHRADDLERSGLERAEAERRARIEFGGHGRFKEECHEALAGNLIDTLVQDVRFSLRLLRKSPGFTLAAVATLALAIGANAVVFGVLNGVILRPLNVPEPESLWGTEYGDSVWQSYLNYVDLRDRNRSFQDLAAFKFVFVGLDMGNDPAIATGFATSGNYFDVLGIRPHLGRFFNAADEHGPNSAPYVVLTHAYWHARFADDPGVVGRTVQINKHPFTIIGVAPPGFRGTLLFVSPDFFMPIVNQEQADGDSVLTARGNYFGVFEAMGHLKPGVTPAQALADMNAVAAYLEKTYPKEFAHKRSSLSRPGLTSFGGGLRAFLAGLMLLAGLILLAACANLGSLFTARAADRSREVALRLALGSSRRRILRQLLTEAVLISLVGGLLGLLVSVVLLHRLSTWQPFSGAPIHIPATPDEKVYLAALVLALFSGFLFGIVPVREVLRANPYEIVKAGSTGRVGRRITVRDLLLGAQIAICAVLVTSSMVAVRGLERSLHGNFGFEPRNTILVPANLTMAGYTGDKVFTMQRRMIDALETIPGVERVGLVNSYPPLVYTAGFRVNVFKDDTTDTRPSNAAAKPYQYEISPGYFRAAGTALLAGRSLSWHDDKNTPRVAVVNRELARTIFGSVTNALGRYYRMQDGTRVLIVGVVEDGKYVSLTENQQPATFLPFLQCPSSGAAYLVVRSTRDPEQLAVTIRSELRELDAGLPVNTKTWSGMLEVVLFPSRMATVSLGVLGLMGAMLSITGVFGMAAYSVSKRRRELGIRVALGAQRKEVLEAALGRAFKLLVLGSAAGLLLGILASRVLAFVVYQATPRDPLVLAGVVLVMLLLGLLATWIPARRALSVDPLKLLREE